MKLLLDANLSPQLIEPLTDAGFDVEHVRDVGLLTAPDSEIFEVAAAAGSVVVTADSDFPMLLALRRATSPSVVLLRHVADWSPADHGHLLIDNLSTVEADLEKGAIVSLSPTRLAVRSLPVC